MFYLALILQPNSLFLEWSARRPGTLSQCWFDVGPASATLAQHQTSTGWTSRVCCSWEDARRHVTGHPRGRLREGFWWCLAIRSKYHDLWKARHYMRQGTVVLSRPSFTIIRTLGLKNCGPTSHVAGRTSSRRWLFARQRERAETSIWISSVDVTST